MLKITVGTTPGNTSEWWDLSKEVRMLKSAVLYADEVEVNSRAFHFVERTKSAAESSQQLPVDDKLKWQEFLVANFYPNNTKQIAELRELQHLYKSGGLTDSKAQRVEEIESEFCEMWSRIESHISEATSQSDKTDLQSIIALSNVRFVESVFARDHINALTKSVNDAHSFPLLDAESGALIAKLIHEGKFTPGSTAVERSSHAGLFTKLFERLPEFGDASVDELLDIRNELEGPLSNFRAEICRLSEEIDSAVWDEGFHYRVRHQVMKNVDPEIKRIEEAITTNPYLRKVKLRLTQNVVQDSWWSLTAAVMNDAALLSVLGSLFSLGKSAAQGLIDYGEAQQQIRGKGLFFIYGLKERL